MEATCSSETSVNFHQTTELYIPEDRTLQLSQLFIGSHNISRRCNNFRRPSDSIDEAMLFFFTGSTAPLGPGLCFSVSWPFLQTVELLGRVISSSQDLYLNTEQHKQNKHIHTPNIHAFCGIRTHDPSVRTSEDSSCLRPLGYRDRLRLCLLEITLVRK
jgi:hypothetical protein